PVAVGAEQLLVGVGAVLAEIDLIEPVGKRPRVLRSERERRRGALALERGDQGLEVVPALRHGGAGRRQLVGAIPERALAVELDHDPVELTVDLARIEDAGRVVALEARRIDPEIADLLDAARAGELPQ